MTTPVIEVSGLCKVYKSPLRHKKLEALRGASFEVGQGEVFGFLGPNGAGKTTTIRILMGLIRPSAGAAKLFGQPVPSRKSRARHGVLPEAPYFYDYLTVAELVDLAGRLFGIDRATRRKRCDELIERVGLSHARDRRLKSYSKGMLQRAGIAQALINDPDLVVLDEPMTGLDPIGRKHVRDIILGLRDQGKTVFFSSHILDDVEAVADRFAIVVKGTIVETGTLAEIAASTTAWIDVLLRFAEPVGDDAREPFERGTMHVRWRKLELSARLSADVDVADYLARAIAAGAQVVSVSPHRETLEDVFVRRAGADEPSAEAGT